MKGFTINEVIKSDQIEEVALHLNHTAFCIVRMVRLALDNDGAGECMTAHSASYAENALEVAEALMSLASEGIERMHQGTRRGVWQKDEAA